MIDVNVSQCLVFVKSPDLTGLQWMPDPDLPPSGSPQPLWRGPKGVVAAPCLTRNPRPRASTPPKKLAQTSEDAEILTST